MDKKAKTILFKTYWSSTGWVSEKDRKTESVDFEYAKEKGLMFDPLTISKSALLSELKNIIQTVPLKKITDAFLCSLTNKRLDWRSGLGSYTNAKRLLTENNIDDYYLGHGTNEDLNVLNFERIKWAGVRHHIGLYNWLDLRLLNNETITPPTENDIQLMQSILEIIRNSDVGETPNKLRDRLKEAFKVSKDERHIIMEILGCADILMPSIQDRVEPAKHDWTFVLNWRGEDKYNIQKVKEYFGIYGIE